MPGQHKHPPLSVRLPESDREWLTEYAASSGKAVNAVIVALVAELRARQGGTTAATAPPEDGKTTRTRKPRADSAPPATFRPAGAHALNCKCGTCKSRRNGDQR